MQRIPTSRKPKVFTCCSARDTRCPTDAAKARRASAVPRVWWQRGHCQTTWAALLPSRMVAEVFLTNPYCRTDKDRHCSASVSAFHIAVLPNDPQAIRKNHASIELTTSRARSMPLCDSSSYKETLSCHSKWPLSFLLFCWVTACLSHAVTLCWLSSLASGIALPSVDDTSGAAGKSTSHATSPWDGSLPCLLCLGLGTVHSKRAVRVS